MKLRFSVYGVAQPKGNMKAFVRPGMKFPIVTESNRNVKSWSQLVAEGASRAILELGADDRALFTEGVRLTIAFYLPRPKALMKRGVAAAHLKAPDLDKLIRAINDALTSVAYVDDSQVVELVATKQYANVDDAAHVDVLVESTAGCQPVIVPPAPLPLLEGML